jgi:hypothetical protein
MPAFVIFHEFVKYAGDGTIDLDSHTFKAVLTNTAPSQANNTVLADVTQIANGNGYTTGGVTLSSVTWAETGAGTGVWRFNAADFSWTASGGDIATFRYVVIYDDTPSSPADPLVGYWDYGAALNVTDGNTFTVDIGANGIFEFSIV